MAQVSIFEKNIVDGIFTDPDIDGGTIDGATIGGATPAAGAFTGLSLANIAEGGTAKLNYQVKRELHTLAAAATSDTTINIPSGAMLLGTSFCVNTAIVDDGGDDTWSSAYTGGSATALSSGSAAAQNTKVDVLIIPEVVGAQTNIRFTANGGSFSAGVIEIITYYMDLTSLANA